MVPVNLYPFSAPAIDRFTLAIHFFDYQIQYVQFEVGRLFHFQLVATDYVQSLYPLALFNPLCLSNKIAAFVV